MIRTISSSQTFLVKFVFPLLWCSVFGAVAIAMGTGVLHGAGNALPPTAVTLALALVWLVGAACFWWFYGRLKRVRLDDGAIYVSNYRREIRVPLTDIAEVTQNEEGRQPPGSGGVLLVEQAGLGHHKCSDTGRCQDRAGTVPPT